MKYYVGPNAIEAPIETSPNLGNTNPAHDITMTAFNARNHICHSNSVTRVLTVAGKVECPLMILNIFCIDCTLYFSYTTVPLN